MANTQTTVPTFVPGQVLEAAQLVNSAATGVPVFATTVTRDAGFGGAGEKALAEGQLCYLESTNVVQYYDGAAWATLAPAPAVSSGLTFITGATVTSGAQIAITNIFSATYTSYLFILNQLDQSVDNETMNIRLGSSGSADTGSNYSEARNSATASGTGGGGANNTDKWIVFQNGGTTNNYFNMIITNPQIAGNTWAVSNAVANRATITGFTTRHILKTVTQYTDLFLFPDTGTVGTIKYQLFGYANS